jgi:sulfate/thiosulfate transport system substrate-binding protein
MWNTAVRTYLKFFFGAIFAIAALTAQQQARAVPDGLNAHVVTLALGNDIDTIAQQGLLDPRWQTRLPNNSTSFYSTIALLVRQGTPKNIRDWNDLARLGVSVVTSNPKTSGGAIFDRVWEAAQRR